MGADCSMILKDESLILLKTKSQKEERIRAIEKTLMEKYHIADREKAIVFEDFSNKHFLSFNFLPYEYSGVRSITMCNGFWVIDTCWRYSSYFIIDEDSVNGAQFLFFDIAQDFGCDDAYICSNYCAWEGCVDGQPFNIWLEDMRTHFGDIKELNQGTKFGDYNSNFPEVFHESFRYCMEYNNNHPHQFNNIVFFWRMGDWHNFAQKYMGCFNGVLAHNSKALSHFFDDRTFSYECSSFGFEMDCGHSMIEAYGQKVWNSAKELNKVIKSIDDVKLIGDAIFSKWRYFNHWSYGPADENEVEWFKILFGRLEALTRIEQIETDTIR